MIAIVRIIEYFENCRFIIIVVWLSNLYSQFLYPVFENVVTIMGGFKASSQFCVRAVYKQMINVFWEFLAVWACWKFKNQGNSMEVNCIRFAIVHCLLDAVENPGNGSVRSVTRFPSLSWCSFQ